MNEKITLREEEFKIKEVKHIEEQKRLENVFAKAQHDFNLTNDNLRKQLGVCEGEISAKNHTLRRLEDECSQLRVDAGQFESKLESMHSEMTSLDSAMASLHGELSVLQRELDEAEQGKKSLAEELATVRGVENALSDEVTALRQDKADGDKAREELELQLVEAAARTEAADAQAGQRLLSLTAERDALQANFVKKDTKLKQQSATNQELNELVSKMHNDLIREKKSHEKVVAEHNTLLEGLRGEAERLRSALVTAEESAAANARSQHGMVDQLSAAQAKSSSLQRDLETQGNEVKKQSKRIERLEREKHDLMMEVASKAKSVKDAEAALTALKSSQEETFENLNEKDKLILQAKVDIQSKDNEIRQLNSDMKDRDDRVLSLERQLSEEKKLKEVSLEAAREQQREHASRIVESNQKSSRLGSDLSAAQSSVEALKKQIIEASSLISSYEKEKEDISRLQATTHSKLQALEDKYEESAARLEASEAELEDVKHSLSSALQAKQKELEEKERQFHVELTNSSQKSKMEVSELQDALSATKRQAESTLERSLSRARNSFQRQLEELQTSHHREVSDARNRVATVATAMESLQRELADECAKSSELMAELEMMRELTDTKSSGAEENLVRLEKDRIKERNNFESFIANLKNQVKSGNKTTSLLQQQLEAATQQLQAEKEDRKRVDAKLREADDALSKQVLCTEELEGEIFTLKRQISENDKKVSYQVQQKVDEIQRVTRRNEVLSEAVTRLTQMNSSDRSQSITTASENKYIFDDTDNNNFGDDSSRFESSHVSGSARDVNSDKWGSKTNRNHDYDGKGNGNGTFSSKDSRGDNTYYGISQTPMDRISHHPTSRSNFNEATCHDEYDALDRKPHPKNFNKNAAGSRRLEHNSPSSPSDVNSSMLRVQQALESRRKPVSRGERHHGGNDVLDGTNINGTTCAAGGDGAQTIRTGAVHTPERSFKKGNSGNVPKLNFNAEEYEREIAEDRTPTSESKDGGLFAVRIRDEVEQGKDRLLPFSPKSASKQRKETSGANNNKLSPKCNTEREVRHSKLSKSDRRALSAPVDRSISK